MATELNALEKINAILLKCFSDLLSEPGLTLEQQRTIKAAEEKMRSLAQERIKILNSLCDLETLPATELINAAHRLKQELDANQLAGEMVIESVGRVLGRVMPLSLA